jgi:hypothetical protein
MRQQLRLRVILPVAVLGLLGAGFGAYATGGSGGELAALPPPATTAQAVKPSEPPSAAPEGSALERALRRDRAVVVVFYTPSGDVDNLAIREARAGAVAVDAGFLSVDVTQNRVVEELAAKHDVLEAPAVLVFVRGPRLVSHFGYADRETVAQAVTNALR